MAMKAIVHEHNIGPKDTFLIGKKKTYILLNYHKWYADICDISVIQS